MVLTLEEGIYTMAIYYAIMLYIIGKYPKNYWFNAMFLFLGTWYFSAMISLFDVASAGLVFPISLLIMNVLVNIFMLIDNAPSLKGKN